MSAFHGRMTVLFALFLAAATLGACSSPGGAPTRLSTQVAPLATTPAAAVASVPIPNPRALAGLGPAEILAMLGQPELKREEAPAELWQYRTADCVLNLIFYRESGGYRLMSVESWTRDSAANSTPTPCRDVPAPIRAHPAATGSAL